MQPYDMWKSATLASSWIKKKSHFLFFTAVAVDQSPSQSLYVDKCVYLFNFSKVILGNVVSHKQSHRLWQNQKWNDTRKVNNNTALHHKMTAGEWTSYCKFMITVKFISPFNHVSIWLCLHLFCTCINVTASLMFYLQHHINGQFQLVLFAHD